MFAQLRQQKLEAAVVIGIVLAIVILLGSLVVGILVNMPKTTNATTTEEARAPAAGEVDEEQPARVEEPTEAQTAPEAEPAVVQPAAEAEVEIPAGFHPDPDLIDISSEVRFRPPARDINLYREFPDVEGVWGKPRAGYNFGYNDACRDVSRLCNIQIPTWKWVVVTGEAINLPGIGSVRDPDGGAALVVVINVWEVPGEFERAFILHGFWGVGEVWDMSDMTDNAFHTDPSYGAFTLETLATLRDHYLNQLGSTEPNPEFRGQCSSGAQCNTVTWVTVLRWYDGSFRLVDHGQWSQDP